MKTKKTPTATPLILLLLIAATTWLTACSNDDTPEIRLRLDTQKCQLMAGSTKSVRLTTHSNTMLEVEDNKLIDAQLIMQELYGISHNAMINITSKGKTGKTSIHITDRETNETATLHVEVTDIYVPLTVISSDHPAISNDVRIFLKNNDTRQAPIYRFNYMECAENAGTWQKQTDATYDLTIETDADGSMRAIITLCYATDADGRLTATGATPTAHKFHFEGSPATFAIMRSCLDTPLRRLSDEEFTQLAYGTRNSTVASVQFRMTDMETGRSVMGEIMQAELPEQETGTTE